MTRPSISGMSFPNFLFLMTGIGLSCIIYLTAHYTQLDKNILKQSHYLDASRNYSFKFPLTSCGDKSAGGTNIWYPVYVEYSKDNLRRIRQYFCCDAFYDSSVNLIQVASFYNPSKGNSLVIAMKAKNFKSATLGIGQAITTYPSYHNYCH